LRLKAFFGVSALVWFGFLLHVVESGWQDNLMRVGIGVVTFYNSIRLGTTKKEPVRM
jgi:hypothetical protein